MLELAIAFAVSGFALQKTPQADFDHQAACHQFRTAAADHVHPGKVINKSVCGSRNSKRRDSNSHQPERAKELV